jgi:hypothetical protein
LPNIAHCVSSFEAKFYLPKNRTTLWSSLKANTYLPNIAHCVSSFEVSFTCRKRQYQEDSSMVALVVMAYPERYI